MKEKIIKIIIDSINDFNEDLTDDEKISTELDSNIYGGNSSLDSMGLVSFIVNLEQFLEDELNKSLSLADEKAMSRKSNPYKNINTLADFVLELLEQ